LGLTIRPAIELGSPFFVFSLSSAETMLGGQSKQGRHGPGYDRRRDIVLTTGLGSARLSPERATGNEAEFPSHSFGHLFSACPSPKLRFLASGTFQVRLPGNRIARYPDRESIVFTNAGIRLSASLGGRQG
jgi:hypothetical protein